MDPYPRGWTIRVLEEASYDSDDAPWTDLPSLRTVASTWELGDMALLPLRTACEACVVVAETRVAEAAAATGMAGASLDDAAASQLQATGKEALAAAGWLRAIQSFEDAGASVAEGSLTLTAASFSVDLPPACASHWRPSLAFLSCLYAWMLVSQIKPHDQILLDDPSPIRNARSKYCATGLVPWYLRLTHAHTHSHSSDSNPVFAITDSLHPSILAECDRELRRGGAGSARSRSQPELAEELPEPEGPGNLEPEFKLKKDSDSESDSEWEDATGSVQVRS